MSRKFSSSPGLQLYVLSAKELWRNRFGMLLLVVIPPTFLAIVEWTSGTQLLPIELYYRHETSRITLSQRNITLVFIGAAVGGFLTAYYAILLFHRSFEYFKYCIGIGLSPISFVAGRFSFFITVVLILGALTTLMLDLMIDLESLLGVFVGFLLVGAIYGAFGGIVGLLSRDFMVAILGVVLLANIDAGWLQNPVFYTTAQESTIIRWLPAFHPTQVVFSAAFSGRWNWWSVCLSISYGSALLLLILFVVKLKIRRLKRWWA